MVAMVPRARRPGRDTADSEQRRDSASFLLEFSRCANCTTSWRFLCCENCNGRDAKASVAYARVRLRTGATVGWARRVSGWYTAPVVLHAMYRARVSKQRQACTKRVWAATHLSAGSRGWARRSRLHRKRCHRRHHGLASDALRQRQSRPRRIGVLTEVLGGRALHAVVERASDVGVRRHSAKGLGKKRDADVAIGLRVERHRDLAIDSLLV
jgi:hypothetical protein